MEWKRHCAITKKNVWVQGYFKYEWKTIFNGLSHDRRCNSSFIMPQPLGAGGIMFSGCPSVRSLKYPLLTCKWVRWSTRPIVTVIRPSICPSVRPERFPGICLRMHAGIGLKFYMLMYLDHLQNWLVYGRGLLIFQILALFWLSETGQIWGFRAFPGERMEGMAWNFARWCILATFRID